VVFNILFRDLDGNVYFLLINLDNLNQETKCIMIFEAEQISPVSSFLEISNKLNLYQTKMSILQIATNLDFNTIFLGPLAYIIVPK